MDEKILDLWKNEIVSGFHPSRIVNKVDVERALYSNRILSILAKDWKEIDDNRKVHDLDDIKNKVKKYNKYVFNKDALIYIKNFLDYLHSNFPNKQTMIRKFPMIKNLIEELYNINDTSKTKSIPFHPKILTISPDSPLFLTTNTFELFERKGFKGIPPSVSWFSIGSIIEPEKTIDFTQNRGAMRVIKYNFITNPKNNQEYPFLEHSYDISMPRIMDARKIDSIPKELIEEYLHDKGLGIELDEPDKNKNILSQYGKSLRPLVVDYLKSFGLDGVIVKDNQLSLFQPERWIRFDSIEQADPTYLALSDLLNNYEHLKKDDLFRLDEFKQHYIPKIAEKNDVDKKYLEILFNLNQKFIS